MYVSKQKTLRGKKKGEHVSAIPCSRQYSNNNNNVIIINNSISAKSLQKLSKQEREKTTFVDACYLMQVLTQYNVSCQICQHFFLPWSSVSDEINLRGLLGQGILGHLSSQSHEYGIDTVYYV